MSTKDVVKLLEANTGARRMSQVFDDWTEMAALAFRNAVDRRGWQEREDQYLAIAGKYDRPQLDRFGEALAYAAEAMNEPADVLGSIYMQLELGNEALGQFFTPYDLAQVMAALNADILTRQMEARGYAELYEPACGAGAFVIAAADQFRQAGFNPQTQLHVTAEDLSAQAVHMVYIHLTLLHIPAVIYRRNTLTQETYDAWHTPAHVLGGWDRKLRHAEAVDMLRSIEQSVDAVAQEPAVVEETEPVLTGGLLDLLAAVDV